MPKITPYVSCEFAVRPFIRENEGKMMKIMLDWATSPDEHLRRLASEGCRPMLPWTAALPKFKENPSPILPILENLKADDSLYVRKSVANNLNDISKNQPELVIEIAKRWYGDNKNTDWIVKHATRTLLKKGNPEALSIFGYEHGHEFVIEDFNVEPKIVQKDGNIEFAFTIKVDEPKKVRLEYAIDFMKKNGKLNRKVFSISEGLFETDRSYDKKHSLKDMSTRKHHVGLHRLALIVNGIERELVEFELEG
ncbi:MAG: DNA alkylation repair protein [Streptococcaceae bacterium]|jgi:3-methyladenine DNA glycosylase AlkC|nr:DNA alkylation repair protein [Streptococcaceae bacterium]